MSDKITVNISQIPEKSYPIYINDSDLKELRNKLEEETKNGKKLVIFSEKVYKIYAKILDFKKSETLVLKDGEQYKNIKSYEKIIKKLIDLKFSRKDKIIAIGGGVVGDIAGFAAATYMRGVEFIQVPTTLLACVDSSVGGKTAIDMPKGKNFVGAFYQPKAVYINLNFLKTLDEKQYKSGLGEVIKYAFIEKSCQYSQDFNLLSILKENRQKIVERDINLLKELIHICLNLKSAVVRQDEKEKGLRKILNLGHTFAHALEEETNYKKYTHGFAVMLGLLYVFRYSFNKGFCSKEYYDEARTLFDMYEYDIPKFLFINKKKVLNYMKTDKKSDGKTVTFILPSNQAEVFEYVENEPDLLKFEL